MLTGGGLASGFWPLTSALSGLWPGHWSLPTNVFASEVALRELKNSSTQVLRIEQRHLGKTADSEGRQFLIRLALRPYFCWDPFTRD